MKKFIQSILYGGLALINYSNAVQAQEVAFAGNKVNEAASPWHAFVNENRTTAKPAATVNAKVIRQFANYHKGAQNVKWYQDQNTYTAFFDEAGRKAHASFGRHGYWNYDIYFGSEKDLPANIRKTIKSNYVDYTIGRTTEVNVSGLKGWVVNLEDEDNLVIARILDGSLDELAHYRTHEPVKTRKARIIIPQ